MIDPNLIDVTTIPNLPTAAFALDNLLPQSSSSGVMSKNTQANFAAFIAPYVAAISSSGYAPTSGLALPTPSGSNSFTIVGGPATYTHAGGNVNATGDLNILNWNGTIWTLSYPIDIDLSNYFTKEEIEADYGVATSTGDFLIKDSNGNIAFWVTPSGLIRLSNLDPIALNKIKNQLGLIETNSGEFSLKDSSGNTSFYISKKGLVSFFDVTPKTRDRLINSKIINKKISIIGDSISTDNGGGDAGLIYPQQYWARMEYYLGCEIFRDAIGGTTITQGGQAPAFVVPSRYESLNSVFTPDIVFIFGGINDFLQGIPLGTAADAVNTTFYGALKELYSNILYRMPNARVFHITPAHTTFTQHGSFINRYPEFNSNSGLFLSDYIEAIEKISRRFGVGLIDVNQNSGITQYNIETLSSDKIHFKAKGHEMVYNTIVNTLNNSL